MMHDMTTLTESLKARQDELGMLRARLVAERDRVIETLAPLQAQMDKSNALLKEMAAEWGELERLLGKWGPAEAVQHSMAAEAAGVAATGVAAGLAKGEAEA